MTEEFEVRNGLGELIRTYEIYKTPPARPDWPEYFLGIAKAVAARSDCERDKVGAVVVNNRRIRATGYNSSPAGMPGCRDCPRRLSDCAPGSDYSSGPGICLSVHAESNALIHCDRADLIDATLYITRAPCYACEKLIRAAGISKVIHATPEYGPHGYMEMFL